MPKKEGSLFCTPDVRIQRPSLGDSGTRYMRANKQVRGKKLNKI